ncbi:hypothetical protein TSUD_220380, partial [Trifolium subterraneum]
RGGAFLFRSSRAIV